MRLTFPDPPLAAGGVALRRLSGDDVPWITEACGDRELSRHVPAIPFPYSQADARAFVARAARDWAAGEGAVFVIARADTGVGLGTVGLHLTPADPGLGTVGYWLCRDARGQGSATSALRLVSGWAFADLGIERLQLITAPENMPSQRVAERAGFTREGLLRAWLPTPQGRRDSVMFSLLDTDISARR
ncbi:MAG: GNAT family N-acetyltransferase [Gemmatimonadota bacterium]